MFESKSKKDPSLAYVFDELKQAPEAIAANSKLQNRGTVTETLDIKLDAFDSGLRDILKDCSMYIIDNYIGKGDYNDAINYMKSVMSREALARNKDTVSVHKINIR